MLRKSLEDKNWRDRPNIRVAPEIHAMLKAFAKSRRISICLATDLLIPRAIAHEEGLPLPSLGKQLADMVDNLKPTNSPK